MEHFSEQAWADFERAVGHSAKAQEIDSHLASGCLTCKADHEFWGRLLMLGQAEIAFVPPENLVRVVKLGLPSAADAQTNKWTEATLIFHSAWRPLTVGIRAQAATCRQLVYEGDGLTMDLCLDRGASGLLSVVGQILDAQDPQIPETTAIILWTEDGRLVTTTGINEFGEFHLEFRPSERMRLTARIGKRRIQIPVADWT